MLILLLVGCAEPLEQWCWDQAGGAQVECDVEPHELPWVDGYRCGPFVRESVAPNFSGVTRYWSEADGELIAVNAWCDVVGPECDVWYGRRLNCDVDCTFEAASEQLPSCDPL